eukprot:2473422-Prorocentrum_lima.AAC.1
MRGTLERRRGGWGLEQGAGPLCTLTSASGSCRHGCDQALRRGAGDHRKSRRCHGWSEGGSSHSAGGVVWRRSAGGRHPRGPRR